MKEHQRSELLRRKRTKTQASLASNSNTKCSQVVYTAYLVSLDKGFLLVCAMHRLPLVFLAPFPGREGGQHKGQVAQGKTLHVIISDPAVLPKYSRTSRGDGAVPRPESKCCE